MDYKVTQATLPGAHPKTLGADRNYDCDDSGNPVIRRSDSNYDRPGGSAIDGRTIRHQGYAQSINARRGVDKLFGWIKQWGGQRQFKVRGTEKVSAFFGLHAIAYNLIRLGNLPSTVVAAA